MNSRNPHFYALWIDNFRLHHAPGDPILWATGDLCTVRLTNLHLQLLPANKNFIFILCPSRKLTMKLKPKRGETETERGKRKSNNSDTYVHATLKEWSAYKTKERNMTPYGIFMRELLHTHSYGYTHPLLICHTDTHAHCDTFPRQNIRNFAYAWWWRGWSRMARDRCHSVAHYICKIWHTNAINHNTAQNTPPIPPHAYNGIIISNAACSQNLRTRGNY